MSSMAGKSQENPGAAEAELVRRVVAKDRDAFQQLFKSYHPRLFRFLFRLTRSHGVAEELTNDVLLTLWTDAGRFRGESKVSTWVFGVAYKKALTHLRKQKFRLVQYEEHEQQAAETSGSLEREDWVRQGVYALPPKQKLTVMLVYYLGFSCEETAAATDVPVSTVKTRMFHARRKLKQHLARTETPNRWLEGNDDDAT